MSNFKKMLIVLSTSFVLFIPSSKSAQAQNVVSAEELNQLSLDEVKIYREQVDFQREAVVGSCQSSSIQPISCEIMNDQYHTFLMNLDNYIEQRRILEGQ
ncbi:hypothetical protein Sta7437_4467 [Stanieria cyanosphaera PCC 7437]|uniref:Uncharacterized protein n=1 Tax=Stanieria cyanosphaera (strain ATCC 29371 / PCC 7437) TaxID=111780 RepID=K9Y0L4_STAC7|nr:hypothetical protein [Stanieria cyanosphaera]AFZ37931.1 hypothetical protein Sta7437_4467 [Stanieria cyanosphaera PCC 7437]